MNDNLQKPESKQDDFSQNMTLAGLRITGVMFLFFGLINLFGFADFFGRVGSLVLIAIGVLDLVILPPIMKGLADKKQRDSLEGKRPEN